MKAGSEVATRSVSYYGPGRATPGTLTVHLPFLARRMANGARRFARADQGTRKGKGRFFDTVGAGTSSLARTRMSPHGTGHRAQDTLKSQSGLQCHAPVWREARRTGTGSRSVRYKGPLPYPLEPED